MNKILMTIALALSAASCGSNYDGPYSAGTIDLGLVVKNEAKMLKFYKEVLQFQQAGQIDVPASITRDSGLSKGHAVKVHVLSLRGAEKDNKLKIIAFPGNQAKANNSYINSTAGLSYITMFVKDITAVQANLKKHGVALVNKAVRLSAIGRDDLILLCVRDPEGNIIELIGPEATK